MNAHSFTTDFALRTAQGSSVERVITQEAATRLADVLMLCRESRLRRQREASANAADTEGTRLMARQSTAQNAKRPTVSLSDSVEDLLIDDETARTLLQEGKAILTQPLQR